MNIFDLPVNGLKAMLLQELIGFAKMTADKKSPVS